ncbi:Pentatricopeptide repeat-containing protein, mitochondrial [Vitis vinifera]|uniref:Pentatricopeptide repeat-containing protein, mitochondrial n=1 Tax=Vitis vinifera TaxID=29760 RepID=A0A438GW41_VITVI|nr:Pentatricopeptide repeat-containing protein, mitochondrial [Vitis vinifera]
MLAKPTTLLLQKHLSRLNSSNTQGNRTTKFLVHCHSQITKHGRNGDLKEAESIFSRMPHKNAISWTAMLTAYYENGHIAKARKMFEKMPQRTTASYNAMITAYTRSNPMMIGEASKLFAEMRERNSISYAAMITGLARAGMVDNAEELYLETPVEWRDPVCSNALISGYLKVGRLEEATRIFEGMGERDVVSWSSMVDGYCKKGKIGHARELFERMPERNVVTWTAMIDGHMKMGCYEVGFGLFLRMRKEGFVKVNPMTLTVMFEACSEFGEYKEGIQMHGFSFVVEARKIFDMMNRKDVVSWNALIAGYVQNDEVEEGKMGKSIELFRMMPKQDDIAWTAVISGFVGNGEYEEAIYWFIEMLRKVVRPNPLTLSSVLSASAGLATLNQGLQIHTLVLKMGMEFDLSVQNSLVSMYTKCGDVADGHQIFTTCTHVGLLEQGWNYFKSMKSLYQIEPGPHHYACIVDLLGRAGFLDDAIDLIRSMPCEPHSGVWGALLGASRIHLRLDVAKLAAQQIFKLEPDNAAPYAVLSFLYSSAGRNRDSEQVRMAQGLKGVKKSAGYSWIIV